MKYFLTLFICLILTGTSYAQECYRQCAKWDTFCKTPTQIVATKCRLGVPVEHEQCVILGQRNRYVYDQASMLPGLPCTEVEEDVTTEEVIKQYL